MKKIIVTTMLGFGILLSSTTAVRAQCGIDCWLIKTFSTRDFVGDWIRDAVGGGIHYNGNTGGSEASKKQKARLKKVRMTKTYEKANKIVSSWKPSKNLFKYKSSKIKAICSYEKVLNIVNKSKNPKVLMKTCFVEIPLKKAPIKMKKFSKEALKISK